VYLAAGAAVALRLWDEPPGEGAASRRDYETVGYVLEGRAVLELMGSQVELSPGDSWLVPRGAEHRYRIRERLRAIEATAPPARADAGDVGDRPEPR
jgi:mannose-6-phosphate isomerase-like protein (cupin superfamily)